MSALRLPTHSRGNNFTALAKTATFGAIAQAPPLTDSAELPQAVDHVTSISCKACLSYVD
jgi:hypothetical protein